MPRTANQITTSMIQTLLSETSLVSNFNVGSLVRSIFDASSAIDAQLDQEVLDLGASNILNAIYGIWGISPLPAIASVYQLLLTNINTSSKYIAQGAQAQIPNSSLIWVTQTAVTIPAQVGAIAGTVTVNAICTVTGSATNVPMGSITSLLSPITGVSVTNPYSTGLILGSDAETQTQTQARAANQIATVYRGDEAAVESGVLQNASLLDSNGNLIEQIVKVKAVDYSPGNMYVYCINNLITPGLSPAMSTFVGQILYGYTDSMGIVHTGYKAGGVVPTVLQAVLNPLIISIAVFPQSNTTLTLITPAIQLAILAFFSALDIEQSFSLGQFIHTLLMVPGVADVLVSTPSGSLAGVPTITSPTVAPTLAAISPSTGTTLAAGTYYVGYTYTNAWGETISSPLASKTITIGQAIRVSAISLPVGAMGVNYYLGLASASPIVTLDVSGIGAQLNLIALPINGASSPPLSNTALIHGNLYVISGTPTITALSV